ncbi:MAG: MFS transporter [Micrococcales bacterium]|nr:MFS transporter [Micrococcales bacterium]
MRTTSIWRVRGMPELGALTLLGFTGYAALLPVAPLWAVRGGADAAGAGLVNGVLLLATVLTQGFIPRALARVGWARVLIVGLLLLGLPSLATAASEDLRWILACSVVRGMGFAVLTVCGSSAVAMLVDPARRGAGIGAYGLAVAVPNVIVLSLAPWAAENLGYRFVFVVGTIPILAIPAAVALARQLPAAVPQTHLRQGTDQHETHPSPARSAVWRALLAPALILLSVTLAGGGVMTFLPQMVSNPTTVMVALLAFGAMTTASRWLVGTIADRHGAHGFVAPLLASAVVGLGFVAWAVRDADSPALLALGLGVLAAGLAYGALQNLTLLMAFNAVPPRRVGTASAVWNVGFDTGTGLGSVLVGVLATEAGFSVAMVAVGAVCAAAIPLALRTSPSFGSRP